MLHSIKVTQTAFLSPVAHELLAKEVSDGTLGACEVSV